MFLLSLPHSCIDSTLMVFLIIPAPYFKHYAGAAQQRTVHLFFADDGNHPLPVDSPIAGPSCIMLGTLSDEIMKVEGKQSICDLLVSGSGLNTFD
jgi:hypothetical protein